ncbi:MAG: 3-isopropylmalate dehydratase large subunit [Candidatus Omnitrophota bacterium]|nr:3-isopropylmalate dehydratase large subunit [Candidatus Omnitrophota bacterium]
MGYTITEKILSAHTQNQKIHPGDFILAKVDLTLGNDITAPLAIDEFEKLHLKNVFNPNRIALVPDHFTPAKDLKAANAVKKLRDFASKYKIKNFFEVGKMGVEHALLPELGLVAPGDLIIGADSHTCTYGALGAFSTGVGSTDLAASWVTGRCWFKVPESIKFIYKGKPDKWVSGKDLILFTIGDIKVDGALYQAMEFCGSAIENLDMDSRFSMCNMAIEAGGKSGIIAPDDITFDYLKKVYSRQSTVHRKKKKLSTVDCGRWTKLRSDSDANYAQIKEYDVSNLEPQVACPHLPSNVKAVSQLKDIAIDQVVIGSCTNGRISDLRIAAKILKGKKAHPRVRLIVIPATQEIYLTCVKEGLAEIFVKAGGVFSTPTCGPCLGGHCGILTDGEVALATTNRNFLGRMGSPKSFVYLSNPAVAAASSIKGRISHPAEIMC